MIFANSLVRRNLWLTLDWISPWPRKFDPLPASASLLSSLKRSHPGICSLSQHPYSRLVFISWGVIFLLLLLVLWIRMFSRKYFFSFFSLVYSIAEERNSLLHQITRFIVNLKDFIAEPKTVEISLVYACIRHYRLINAKPGDWQIKMSIAEGE